MNNHEIKSYTELGFPDEVVDAFISNHIKNDYVIDSGITGSGGNFYHLVVLTKNEKIYVFHNATKTIQEEGNPFVSIEEYLGEPKPGSFWSDDNIIFNQWTFEEIIK